MDFESALRVVLRRKVGIDLARAIKSLAGHASTRGDDIRLRGGEAALLELLSCGNPSVCAAAFGALASCWETYAADVKSVLPPVLTALRASESNVQTFKAGIESMISLIGPIRSALERAAAVGTFRSAVEYLVTRVPLFLEEAELMASMFKFLSNLGMMYAGSLREQAPSATSAAMVCLKRHYRDFRTAQECLSAMACMGMDPIHAAVLMADGALEVTLRAMDCGAAHSYLNGSGCAALCTFAQAVPLVPRLMAGGAPARIVAALRRFSGDPNVMAPGLQALSFLAHTNAFCDAITRLGVVEVAVEALRRFDDFPPVIHFACLVIRNLSTTDLGREEALSHNAPSALIRALKMKWAPTHAGVTATACGALRNIASVPGRRAALMDNGAGKFIVQAMKAQSNDEDTIFAGCGALFALACEGDNRAALHACGATEVVSKAMQRFAGDRNVVWAICGVILKLAEEPSLRSSIMAKDGALALEIALRYSSDDARIKRAATAGLALLVPGRVAGKR